MIHGMYHALHHHIAIEGGALKASTQYERHALSRIYDHMDTGDRRMLRESLLNNGFIPGNPIVLYEGMILDGFHRYSLCQELKITPEFTEFRGSKKEAIGFVFSANLARRHLTARQRVLAMLRQNDELPPNERLSLADIQAFAGKNNRVIIDQLRRVNEIDPDMAEQVVKGHVSASDAVRRSLHEIPDKAPRREHRLMIELRNRNDIEKFYAACERTGLTEYKALQKAVSLLHDWSKQYGE